jgi:Meiotically Up-regulated Gene 113 (MUG113) protein
MAATRFGYVYFIWAKRSDRIKIGFTLHDPNLRFIEINVGSPEPLTKHALMRGTRQLEKELHRRFKRFKAKGEWFRFKQPIDDFIADEARVWHELLAEERAREEKERAADILAMQAEHREVSRRMSTAWMLGEPLSTDPPPRP